MKVRFFDPGKAYLKVKPEMDAAIQDVLARGDLILRKDLEQFEDAFAKYVGTKYAVGVASGTDALILTMKAIGVGEGDVVLCPSYTFRATIEAVIHCGATVKLYDYDSPISLDDADFFLPAHIAGEVTHWARKAIQLAKQFEIPVIEDAAQAVGAAPVEGLAACYSFYPAKLLGCYGDGGAIATNDKDLYDLLILMRNHYKGDWSAPGFNSRLDNLQAAVLNVKMRYLPWEIMRRKEIALRYDKELRGVLPDRDRMVYQDYIICVKDREGLKAHLDQCGVETLENGYPFPDMVKKGPKCKAYESMSLRIPCNPTLTDEEVSYVIDSINAYARYL